MAADQGEQYKNALKATEQIIANQKAIKDGAENIKGVWNQISSTLFGLSSADYFEEVPKTTEEIIKQQEALADMNENVKKLETGFIKAFNQNEKVASLHTELLGAMVQPFQAATISSNSFFQGALEDIKRLGVAGVNSEEDLIKLLNGELALTQDIVDSIKEKQNYQKLEQAFLEKKAVYDRDVNAKLAEAIKDNKILSSMAEDDALQVARKLALTGDLDEATKDLTHAQREAVASMTGDKNLVRMNIELNQAKKGFEAMTEEAKKATKETFSLGKAIKSAAKNITKDWVQSIVDFDSTIHQIQRDTGILMDSFENSQAFAKITTNAALFGMELKDASEYMSGIADALNTTDFGTVAGAFKDLQAVEGATGAARQDIIGMTGEMMRMGSTSEQVKDAFQDIDKSSRMFGVSSRKTIADISKNLGKFKNFGFQGGEKSLKNMVITAQRLRANVDEIFEFTTKARTIEGAMDMAASLQLAGGSFSKLNPMDLLSAARKGPKEMTKILAEMGSDIGKFNAKGEFEIDPIDADRLQLVSEATGLSLETLRNSMESTALQNAKLKMFPESMFNNAIAGMEGVDKELAKSTLGDMLERGKDGKITVKADMQSKMDAAGIKDLEHITSDQMKLLLKNKQEETATLEEQNKRNQSFKEAMTNLANGIMGALAVFQPIIERLGKFFIFLGDMFGKMGQTWKTIVSLFILGVAMFSTSVGQFIAQGVVGFGKNIAALFSGSGRASLLEKLKPKPVTPPGGGGMGPGPWAPGPGMDEKGGKEQKGFLEGLSAGIKSFNGVKYEDLLKFALSLAIIGTAIIGFGYAMAKIGGDAGIGQMVTAVVSLGVLMGGVLGLSYISKSVDMGGLLKGAAAMLLISVSLIPFAYALQMLSGLDLGNVLGAIGIMALAVLGLIGLGAMLMAAGPLLGVGIAALIATAAGLALASLGLLAASAVFEKLSSIDWSGFSAMGSALLSVVPGLIGFSFAALMFANPLTLLGIFFMTSALESLVAVMAPLASSLELGSTSLDSFASGLDKLGEAADRLSLEKLEELRDLTADLSEGGISFAAIAGSLSELAGKLGGSGKGSSGGSENRTITVNLKLNGRDIQSVIIDDTEVIK